jgi:glutathione S-transferase
MVDKVTLYSNSMSRGRTVQWLLDELGAPYDLKVLDLAKGEQKAPQYLAINRWARCRRSCTAASSSRGRGDLRLSRRRVSAGGLAPKLDDPKRGTYLRWIFFGVGCFEPAVLDKMFIRPPSRAARRDSATARTRRRSAVLETALTPGHGFSANGSAPPTSS